MRTAVRIVFNAFHARGHTILVASKIHDPVMLFVPAAVMPDRNMPVVVSTGGLGFLFDQRVNGAALKQAGGNYPHYAAAPR